MEKALPLSELINEAFARPWHIRDAIFKALVIPIGLGVLVQVLRFYYSENQWLNSLYGIIDIVVHVVIAITCHRLILIGEGSVPKYGLYRWSMRETWFTIWVFAIYFVSTIVAIPLALLWSGATKLLNSMLLASPVFIAMLIIYGVFMARFSTIFPHVALDNKEENTIKWSWELTSGHTLKLIVMIMIFPIVISIPLSLFTLMFSDINQDSIAFLINSIFWGLVGYFLTVFVISALSVSYKWLIDNQD